ncbi:MAG: hypothetical protein QW567_00825 [Candidatus Hadarchaeales archaeon]
MTIREALGIVALVVLIQLSVGAMFYLFIGAAPGVDLTAILAAILIMAAVAGAVASLLVLLLKKYAGERTMRIALMTLSEDERKVFEAILRAGGEARQDKLRRELDMSKAKLSALVNNLERKQAITKTRYWKTNILRVRKEFTGG